MFFFLRIRMQCHAANFAINDYGYARFVNNCEVTPSQRYTLHVFRHNLQTPHSKRHLFHPVILELQSIRYLI